MKIVIRAFLLVQNWKKKIYILSKERDEKQNPSLTLKS